MYKNLVSALCGCLYFVSVPAQTDVTAKLLSDIEINNNELKAFRSFVDSRKLVNQSGNNLPDPQLSGYYLPYGDNMEGKYKEYQISQSLEFPTVYAARSKWNQLQEQQLESSYEKLRQQILLRANKFIAEMYVLNRQKELELIRRQQSEKVYSQIQELYNKEQLGILDLNKAKIAWLQQQFVLDHLEIEIQNVQAELQKLNGGAALSLNQIGLDSDFEIGSREELWLEKQDRDPELQQLILEESASLQRIRVEENKVLPDLTAGYNYQGVSGNNFSGFYGGISIPIWNSKNKVKAAEAEYEYRQSNTMAMTESLYTVFIEKYAQYQLLLEKYQEYQETMKSLDSESLLLKAFELGELSFMEYHLELRFYREALDRMLELEKDLYQLRAELLKHRL